MKETYLTFEEEFKYFYERYDLQYIQSAIETWLDFQIIQKDIMLFIKSPNERHDEPRIQRDATKDVLLDMIIEFDLQRSKYLEINKAFTKLNATEKNEFYKIFFEKGNTEFFGQFDLFIKVAKTTDDYMFSEEIETYYSALKQAYLQKLEDKLSERKQRFEFWMNAYPILIHTDWKEGWHLGNGEASRHRTMFILATLFKDGLISEKFLFESIKKYRGAKKYYKYVVSHI